MKIAIFADIHGNYEALEATLAAIEKEDADLMFCAGDMTNPFPGSIKVWDTLQQLNVPMVRGNHEDYLLAYYTPAKNPHIREGIQFMPVQWLAQQMSIKTLTEIENLPTTLTVPGPNGDDILICHASPSNTSKSFSIKIDEAMAADLNQVAASTIVGGHIHQQWERRWHDKHLILTGSVGLPFQGVPAAEYLILTHQNGGWRVAHKTAPYDHQKAMRSVLESNFLREGGPLAWLMFDELWTAELRLVPFLSKFCPNPKPTSLGEWQTLTRRYLQAIGRWDYVRPYVEEVLLV